MQVSTVMISAESIIPLAQTTINSPGLKCEWGGGKDACNVVAACWEALRKHYHWHLCDLKSKRQKHNHVQCRLPRCSAPIHSSIEALRHHIETSHLSRIAVLCPVDGCRSGATLRSNTILKHFTDEHSHLNGKTEQLPSELLRPSWKPFYPSKTTNPLPPLPLDPDPGCILVTASPAATRLRKNLLTSVLESSQTSTPFTSPRKQSQRQIPTKEKEKAEEDTDDLTIPDFGPLPGYPESACHKPQELVVWRPPTVFDMDVARPQRMRQGPIKETLTSILYDVFAKRVDELERKGLLS